MTYMHNGRQFIVVGARGTATSGAQLVAFAFPPPDTGRGGRGGRGWRAVAADAVERIRRTDACNAKCKIRNANETQRYPEFTSLSHCLHFASCISHYLRHAQHETASDIEDGGRVFRQSCANCHGPDGNEIPGIDLGRGVVQDREDRRGSRQDHSEGRARHADAGDEHVRRAGGARRRVPAFDCRNQDQRDRGRRRCARQGALRGQGRLRELSPRRTASARASGRT